MDIDKEEHFCVGNFKVFLEVPKEEYILSDSVTSETSLSSRLHLSMELKPEPEELEFDPLGDDKLNLKKSVTYIRNEESDINFEEEFLTVKKESKCEDGIEEELIRFENQEEIRENEEILSDSLNITKNIKEEEEVFENEENFVAKLNTTKSRKRGELQQEVTSLHLQTSSPIITRQTCPNPLRGYKQRETETSAKSANPDNLKNVKTEEIQNYITLHSQNIKHQCTSSFSRDPQQLSYQDTAIVPRRNMVNTHTNNFKTSTVVENMHNNSCECSNCKTKGTSCGSKRKLDCQKCGKSFKREAYVNRHMSEVHSEEKRFVCNNCCKAYTTKYALEYHILSYHNKSAFKSKCKTCRKYFANKDILSHHIQQAHSETKVNVSETCDICQKVFQSRPNMLAHKLRKHNPTYKKFICNDCSAVFSARDPLIRHIKVWHMSPEFKCSLCSECFPTKVRLQAHLRQEHGKDNRKSYICETCGKTTKTRWALETHQTTHSLVTAYVCEDCGKSFKTYTHLLQHSRIHSDIRPFSCNLCDKSFRIRHHLRQHMAVHGMDSIPDYNKRARRNRTTNDSEGKEKSSPVDCSS